MAKLMWGILVHYCTDHNLPESFRCLMVKLIKYLSAPVFNVLQYYATIIVVCCAIVPKNMFVPALSAVPSFIFPVSFRFPHQHYWH
jgi:hypothetical protein